MNNKNALLLANQKIAELTADLQRTRADFENYRKQIDAQKITLKEVTENETVLKLLPLLDDLDRAISNNPNLKPLEKSLAKSLVELNLIKLSPELGTEFNPDLHDAVAMEEGEGKKAVISEVLRAGYLYKQQVLRPAMVKVKNI